MQGPTGTGIICLVSWLPWFALLYNPDHLLKGVTTHGGLILPHPLVMNKMPHSR